MRIIYTKDRLKQHTRLLSHNKHENNKLQSIFNKYKDNLRYFIITEDVDIGSLRTKEQEVLDKIIYDNKYKIANLILDIIGTGSNGCSVCKSISCYDKIGNLIGFYKNARIAASELGINKHSIKSCCMRRQKLVNNLLFFYTDDTTSISEFKTNPYKYLQIKFKKPRTRRVLGFVGKKWSEETTLKMKNVNDCTYHVEVYNFTNREKLGYYTSILKAAKKHGFSKHMLRKNAINDTFVLDDYLIRLTKIKKGAIPKGYYYRPLQPGITIERDVFDELKVITKFNILKGSTLGISHVKLKDGQLIRCEIGGFLNSSSTPNCTLVEIKKDEVSSKYCVVSIRDIIEGEELTLDYKKELCGVLNNTNTLSGDSDGDLENIIFE